MMDWEAPLMKRHAEIIAGTKGDVMNVGFGMGIIDGYLQTHNPRSHTIIEAHPDVHAHMIRQGWPKKKGVRVEFGRWQTVLEGIIKSNEALEGGNANPDARLFDGVFFDTYGEDYDDLREFHELLPKIMRWGSLCSFLGRDLTSGET